MNSRERILNTLAGKPTDHVAVSPYVYTNVVREWRKKQDIDPITDTIAYYDRFGFDVILRNFNIRPQELLVSTPQWQIESTETQSGNNRLVDTTIHTPGGKLHQVVVHTNLTECLSVSSIQEHMIKEPEDFELLKAYQPAPVVDVSPLIRAKAEVGDKGIVAPWCTGIFNYMSELRNLESLLMDPFLDEDFYGAFASYCQARLNQAIEPVLAEGTDMLCYTGNIASATMVGSNYFEEWVLPYEKQRVDLIQSRCQGIIYHNCGDSQGLIDGYNKLGMRCFETMTEPPYADNELEAFLQGMRQDITLMGNIDQIQFLKTATPAQVTEKARSILEKAKVHPRFILGTSDFLEEGTPAENLRAIFAAVKA